MRPRNKAKTQARYAARGGMTAVRVKELVRERDGDRCAHCGMVAVVHMMRWGRALEVHRIVPGSIYTVAGCVTLCKDCHEEMPTRQRGEPDAETEGITVRIPIKYKPLLQRMAKEQGVSITQVAMDALTAYYKKLGFGDTGTPAE